MAAPALMLAGATGLVGKQALERLLRAGNWTVCVPARSDLGVRHARLQVAVGDLDNAATLARIEGDLPTLDAFACAIGTTLKKAGSAAAFAAVDRDMVLALANLARRRGARHAVVVSSVGAVAGSSNLYLRVKGEMEAGIEALGFERCDFLQPGLLLGARGERRPGEHFAQRLAPLYNPLLRGPLRRYRAVESAAVAAALVVLLQDAGPGTRRWDNVGIEDLARRG